MAVGCCPEFESLEVVLAHAVDILCDLVLTWLILVIDSPWTKRKHSSYELYADQRHCPSLEVSEV